MEWTHVLARRVDGRAASYEPVEVYWEGDAGVPGRFGWTDVPSSPSGATPPDAAADAQYILDAIARSVADDRILDVHASEGGPRWLTVADCARLDAVLGGPAAPQPRM